MRVNYSTVKPFTIMLLLISLAIAQHAQATTTSMVKRFDRDFGWWYFEKQEQQHFTIQLFPIKRANADKIALFIFRYANRRCHNKKFTIESGKGMEVFNRHLSNSHKLLNKLTVNILCDDHD